MYYIYVILYHVTLCRVLHFGYTDLLVLCFRESYSLYIPEGAILVTADVIELYPIIPHAKILNVLRKQYDKFMHKKMHTEDIIKMADFILRHNFFELNSKFFQRISGLLWVLNLSPNACIFMDYIETEILKTQSIKPWVLKRFFDGAFF